MYMHFLQSFLLLICIFIITFYCWVNCWPKIAPPMLGLWKFISTCCRYPTTPHSKMKWENKSNF